MPQMADISVKKADGTTNVTYTALTPSAGDTVAARWRENTQAAVVGNRPAAMQFARMNGTGRARVVTTRVRFPIVRSEGGVTTLIGILPMELSGTISDSFSQSEIDEAVAQSINLFSSTLIRSGYTTGYAPT